MYEAVQLPFSSPFIPAEVTVAVHCASVCTRIGPSFALMTFFRDSLLPFFFPFSSLVIGGASAPLVVNATAM